MEHILKSQAEVVSSGSISALEYVTSSESMNLSLITITGRYPESGLTTNKEVDSLVQIIKGSGFIGFTDSRTPLVPGDQIHLSVGDMYFFEGDLEIIYAASPKWNSEQAEHINQ